MIKTMALIPLLIVIFLVSFGRSKISYTITFDTQGGLVINPVQITKQTSEIEMPKSPTKVGHEFERWFTDITYTQS